MTNIVLLVPALQIIKYLGAKKEQRFVSFALKTTIGSGDLTYLKPKRYIMTWLLINRKTNNALSFKYLRRV